MRDQGHSTDARQVRPWGPPPVDEPSRWQMAVAGEVMGDEAEEIERVLEDAVGAQVGVESVELVERLPDVAWLRAGRTAFEESIARALVSAKLGFGEVAEVDLAGAVERELLREIGEALARWMNERSFEQPGRGRRQVWMCAGLRCGDVSGQAAVAAAWDSVWEHVRRRLAEAGRRVPVAVGEVEVEIEAAMAGPKLTVGRLLEMQPGEFVPLPLGAKEHVEVRIGGRVVAVGKLGARRGKKAVKVQRALIRSGGTSSG